MRTWSLRVLQQFSRLALNTFHMLAAAAAATFKSRAALHVENLAPTRRSAALREAAETDSARSTPLGMALPALERLAICSGHRQTRHRDCLAPQELSAVLGLEDPARQAGAAGRAERRACPDSYHELREPTLGRAAD